MKIACCCILYCWASWSYAQGLFTLTKDKPLTFKFDLVNHLVLVPVTINGVEFSFLMDTGVKETILFAHTDDSLFLNNQHKIKFQGLGAGAPVEGIISTGNVVIVGGVAIDSLHWLYVVQGEDLDISSSVGVGINGILGSTFFRSFPLKINYIRQRITIFPPDYDYSVRGYTEIPVEILNDKPYVLGSVLVDEAWMHGKLLVDMGNSDPFMLFAFLLPHFEVREPYIDAYIGQGFNGPIYGKRNRIRQVSLYGFDFDYPIVSYPDSTALQVARLAPERIGSIGNQSLQRMHLLMDYKKERFYIRKNRQFGKAFLLNMSGIEVKHAGMTWTRELVQMTRPKSMGSQVLGEELGVTIDLTDHIFHHRFTLKPIYIIDEVRQGSPAARAGVQPGDTLIRINGARTNNLTLSRILSKLQTKPYDQVRLILRRSNEDIRVHFRLEDPIPYHL